MDQCSVLYITSEPRTTHVETLRTFGFSVHVVDDLPPAEVFLAYHAVVVRVSIGCNLPSLAARLRAKPRFGRRVLIALVSGAFSERQRREATASGFDVALDDACTARDLAARILRGLRPYPEYRCLLRSPQRRRRAA